jgi:hypothetical protein
VIIILVVSAAIVGSMLANAWYTQHVADTADRRQAELRVQSDQRWCALFALLDPAAPPTTDRGRTIQTQLRRLEAAFHCKEIPR